MTTETTQFVIEFDYNLEALVKVKEELSLIDKTDISEIEEAVKKIVKIRRKIQEKGKQYRDEANAFNKKVLDKEKEYVGIIEPLEVEYKELLEKEKERQVIEARKELLPNKKRQLSVLKVLMPSDEEILLMDEQQWIYFYDEKFAEHEYALEQEAKQAQQEKEMKERAEQQAKEQAQREEQIKKEAEERAEREKIEALKKAEEDKIRAVEEVKREAELKALREKQQVEEKVRKEKEEEEAKTKAEQNAKLKMEADKKYQSFLKENNYNQETDIIQNSGNSVVIYRRVAEFNK